MVSTTCDTSVNIPGPLERDIWTVCHVLIALLSLTGDSVILLGTIKYRAIKLHRVILAVIQHIAVSNLMLTLFRVVPSIAGLVFQGWNFGTFLCLVNMNLAFIFTPSTAVLTVLLTTSKYFIVKYPLKAETWTTQHGHVICGVVWIVCLLLPHNFAHWIYTTTESLCFDYIFYVCNVNHMMTTIPVSFLWFQYIFGYFVFFIMLIVLISTSVLLVWKAKRAALRHNQSVRWQGVMTATLTAGIFLVFYLPDIVVPLIAHLTSFSPSNTALRAVAFLENVNIIANFIVYALAVRSFRNFLSESARQIGMKVGLVSPPVPPRVRSCVRSRDTTLRNTPL